MVLNASLLSVRDRLLFVWNRSLDPKKCHARVHRSGRKVKPSQKDPPMFPRKLTASDLSSGDSLADAGAALPRAEVGVLADNGLGLLDSLLSLGEDELDVAGVGHVGVDLHHVLVSLRPARAVQEIRGNVRDRERGMCGGAAWEPG